MLSWTRAVEKMELPYAKMGELGGASGGPLGRVGFEMPIGRPSGGVK